jgi:hypothetical protein
VVTELRLRMDFAVSYDNIRKHVKPALQEADSPRTAQNLNQIKPQ